MRWSLTLTAVVSIKSRMALALAKDASPVPVASVHAALCQLLKKSCMKCGGWVTESLNEDCASQWFTDATGWVNECPWHPFFDKSPDQHKDWMTSVRVTWEFWGTRTTLCSSPSSLYTETNQWPSSMKKFGRRRTSFCKNWKDVMRWNREGELSKFLHLKVVKSVKLGLMLWCTQSSNLSKVGIHCSEWWCSICLLDVLTSFFFKFF